MLGKRRTQQRLFATLSSACIDANTAFRATQGQHQKSQYYTVFTTTATTTTTTTRGANNVDA
jgi:hypothetical protein